MSSWSARKSKRRQVASSEPVVNALPLGKNWGGEGTSENHPGAPRPLVQPRPHRPPPLAVNAGWGGQATSIPSAAAQAAQCLSLAPEHIPPASELRGPPPPPRLGSPASPVSPLPAGWACSSLSHRPTPPTPAGHSHSHRRH